MSPYRKAVKQISSPRSAFHSHIKNNVCRLCNGEHRLSDCPQFTSLSIPDRKNALIKYKLCLNCLRSGHESSKCPSKFSCKKCSRRHHTTIHIPNRDVTSVNNQCSLKSQTNKSVLLSTAVCMTYNKVGKKFPVRILLDSGSQANFCTMNFARRMGLQLVKSQLPIAGINNSLSQADFSTKVRLHSRYKPFTLNVHCAVLPSITNNLPAESFNLASLNLPKRIFLSLIHI